jgi:hypothetical protein
MAAEHQRPAVPALWGGGLRVTTPSAKGSGERRDAHRGLNRPERQHRVIGGAVRAAETSGARGEN